MITRDILCRSALTPSGWVAPAHITIDSGGFITAVAGVSGSSPESPVFGHVVPGMPNLHSHAFQRQIAGLTETASGQADTFWTWREAMYRVAGQVTPEQMQANAAWLQVEMLEAGFTSCAEFHYIHHQPDGRPYDNLAEMGARLLAAAADSGMALTVLPVLYCRSGFDSMQVAAQQVRFFNTPERFMRLMEAYRAALGGATLHRLGVAPHSLRAVSAAQLKDVLGALEAQDVPLHIHIAEQPAEVEECLHVLGARPVEWLLDHFRIDSAWCLVHATHMTEVELRRAARSGAVAGLCPITEADLGDGQFRAEAWCAAGGLFGIGSDSNLRLSVTEELRLLEFQCRMRLGRRNVLSDGDKSCGRSLFERAVTGGARALGQTVGKIQAGYRADLLELDDQGLLLEGLEGDELMDCWLFAGGSAMIRTVWVGGRPLVVAGRHIRRDRIEQRFRQARTSAS